MSDTYYRQISDNGIDLVVQPIEGAGGGSPTSVDANMRSKSTINFQFLLSAGQIAGFPQGQNILKYIYFNNTPVMNSDGTVNFLGVTADWRDGTQMQSIIPGTIPGAESPVSVNQQVFKSYGPVVRSVINTLATAIRVTLYCPSLQRSDKDGTIFYSRVDFNIYLSSNGGTFVLKVADKFEGRTAGGYARDYTIDVNNLAPPYQIKVERVSDDIPPTNTLEQNSLYWQTYTTILQRLFTYPNSALLFVSIDTLYFNSQPTVSILLMGIICPIPTNYNPDTRAYMGNWDGTFTRAYTTNPAWCLLKLMTDDINGLGRYITLDRIDKWSLYAMARYCDEVVSNGYGGSEPRYAYNYYMTTRLDALQQIQTILSQIRGIAYYAGGLIFFAIDRPGQVPVVMFNETDTIRENDENGHLSQPPFTYDYVSLKQKHAIAHVNWYDQNQFGKKKTEYLDLIEIGYGLDFDRYGQESIEIDLAGCTSQAEARRQGRYLLATGRLEGKTVLFATNEHGRYVKPSDLIQVFDAHEQGARYSGQIVSGTVNGVVLDSEVTISNGGTDVLLVMINGVEVSADISNIGGVFTELTFFVPLTNAPQPGAIWGVVGAAQPEIYRVISVGNPSPNKYTIAAIISNPIKYALSDGTDSLTPSAAQSPPLPPSNLIVQVVTGGYLVSWLASTTTNVTGYYLEYESQGSNSFSPIATPPGAPTASISLPNGTYIFRVRAINIYNQYSTAITSTPAYATSGIIAGNSLTGTALLDKEVSVLSTNGTYYLQTNCVSPPGGYASLPNLVSPYVDRRKIVSTNGVTKELSVLPDFRGESTRLLNRPTALQLEYTPGYLIVAGVDSSVTFTFSNGTAALTIPTGEYILTDIQQQNSAYISSIAIAVGTIATFWQYPLGKNPILGSQWSISNQPLEQIGTLTANGDRLTI